MADSNTQKPAEQAPQTVSVDEYNKVKSRAERFEAKLTDYEKRFDGVDIDALKAAKDERDILARQLQEKDASTEGLYQKAEESVGKRFADKLAALQKDNESLLGKLKDHKVVATTIAKMGDSALPNSLSLIEPVIRRELDLVDDEIVVKNEKGEVRYSKADPNKRMSVDEFIDEIKGRYDFAFRAETKSGGKESVSKNQMSGQKLTYAELKSLPPAQQKEIMSQMSAAELQAALRS